MAQQTNQQLKAERKNLINEILMADNIDAAIEMAEAQSKSFTE